MLAYPLCGSVFDSCKLFFGVAKMFASYRKATAMSPCLVLTVTLA